MFAVLTACSSARPIAHVSARPDWAVFPSLGAPVSETMLGLFDQREDNFRLSLREVRIFRTTSIPWEEIALEDLPPPIELASGSYAIAAHRYCRAWADEPILVGANEWYVFQDGRLTAYDSRTYRDGCGFTPALEPAQGSSIETEAHVRQWMAENFPGASEPRVVHYVKGIAYADADRVDVAEQYLASGDSSAPAKFTTTLRRHTSRPGSANFPREVDDVAARDLLVLKIEQLRNRPAGPGLE